MTTVQRNPFYLLKVSCSAEKREIVAAVDEMSFFLDAAICSNAQNELINLNKRLLAETNWFIDVDDNAIDAIRKNIDNNEPISSDGLTSLSRLNATIYNLSLSTDLSPYKLGYYIVDIDEQYTSLDEEAITDAIDAEFSHTNNSFDFCFRKVGYGEKAIADYFEMMTEQMEISAEIDPDAVLSRILTSAELIIDSASWFKNAGFESEKEWRLIYKKLIVDLHNNKLPSSPAEQ